MHYETRNQPQRLAARICFRAVENGWDAESDDFQNLRYHPIDQGRQTERDEFLIKNVELVLQILFRILVEILPVFV